MTKAGFFRDARIMVPVLAAVLFILLLTAGCAPGVSRPAGASFQGGPDNRKEVISPSAHDVEGMLDPLEGVLDVDTMAEERFVPGSTEDDIHDELSLMIPTLSAEQADMELALAVSRSPVFDYPMVLNKKVLGWIDHYTNVNRKGFLPGLVRSGKYIAMFRKIFAEEGIPRDLVYMAHVESAYKTHAYSRAHAKGIYQFISSTGRRYGLRIDWWVDERSDPEKSARAAARYLKKLYGDFGDWYLALAAYNGGEGRVERAISRTGKKDFWEIADTRYLRRETRNYVPAILAATQISKQPEKYGFEFEPAPMLRYDTIVVDGAADLRVLGECAGADFETMKELNPALRRFQTPPDSRTDVRVPKGTAEKTLLALAEVPVNKRVLYTRHVVRRGDTLSGIARRYGVSISSIQTANNMGRRTLIREGKVLVVPTVAAGNFSSPYDDGSYAAAGSGSAEVTYRVRGGDTLYGISRRYDTTPAVIAAANGIHVNKILSIGERLKVYPGVRSSATARSMAAGGGAASGDSTRVHTVRRGDNLWRIAKRYSTSVERLCALNRISRHDKLYPGMKLTVY